MSDEIETQTQWVEGAGERYERELAKLYTTQGGTTSKIYSEEEHERRVTVLRDDVDTALGDATAVADRIAKAAQATLDRQAHGDPGDSLTEAQLVKANARRPFVEEDCQKLPHAALTARVKTVLDAEDASNAYLYHRGLEARLGAVDASGQAGALSPEAAAERQELRALTQELNTILRGPNAPREAERAGQDLTRTRVLRTAINKVANKAYDTQARTERALRATGRYSL